MPNEQQEKSIEMVYEDRNLLACALTRAVDAPSGWKWDPAEPGWAVMWIETPMGQVSWHVPRDMALGMGPDPGWADYDGYDREEKNDRLREWITEGL